MANKLYFDVLFIVIYLGVTNIAHQFAFKIRQFRSSYNSCDSSNSTKIWSIYGYIDTIGYLIK